MRYQPQQINTSFYKFNLNFKLIDKTENLKSNVTYLPVPRSYLIVRVVYKQNCLKNKKLGNLNSFQISHSQLYNYFCKIINSYAFIVVGCVRACLRACVRACVRACACVIRTLSVLRSHNKFTTRDQLHAYNF